MSGAARDDKRSDDPDPTLQQRSDNETVDFAIELRVKPESLTRQ
jgi:hypothetical protein